MVLTNEPHSFIYVKNEGELGTSDHVMLSMEMEEGGVTGGVAGRGGRNWRKADYNAMRADIGEIRWELELENKNVEDSWILFSDTLTKLIEKHVPKGNVKNRDRPKWINQETLELMRWKRAGWKKFKAEGTNSGRQECDEVSKRLKKPIRRAKSKMERRLAESDDKGKKFRSYVKSKTKSKTQVGPIITDDGLVLTNPADMAQEIIDILDQYLTVKMFTVSQGRQ